MFWEVGSSGRDYADFFRDEALRLGLTITREVKLEPNPRNMKENLVRHARHGHRGDLLRRVRLRDVPLRRRVPRARLGPAPRHGHRVHVLFELERVGRGPRGLARRRPARRGRHEPELRGDGEALRGALRSQDAQRGGRARLRHGACRDPRDRELPDPDAEGRQRRARADPVDAGDERWAVVLRPVRPRRPQGVQGRLPHDPRAARRRAALRRLLPSRVAVATGRRA